MGRRKKSRYVLLDLKEQPLTPNSGTMSLPEGDEFSSATEEASDLDLDAWEVKGEG